MSTDANDEPANDSEVLPSRSAYPFLEASGLQAEAQTIRSTPVRMGGYTSSIPRGMVADLLKRKGLLNQFVMERWPGGGTDRGKRRIERYLRLYARFVDQGDEAGAEEDDNENIAATSFAYEDDLRDYLSDNLQIIEPGLQLWSRDQAVEFPVDDSGRRVDILARDASGLPVVIELKVSRGHERTIGQSLYYRSQVKDLFNLPRARIIIVAREISDELKVAVRDLPDVELFEYRLSMTLRRI